MQMRPCTLCGTAEKLAFPAGKGCPTGWGLNGPDLPSPGKSTWGEEPELAQGKLGYRERSLGRIRQIGTVIG